MTRLLGTKGTRWAVALMLGVAVAVSLSACGKKGPPEKPDPTYPHSYPSS